MFYKVLHHFLITCQKNCFSLLWFRSFVSNFKKLWILFFCFPLKFSYIFSPLLIVTFYKTLERHFKTNSISHYYSFRIFFVISHLRTNIHSFTPFLSRTLYRKDRSYERDEIRKISPKYWWLVVGVNEPNCWAPLKAWCVHLKGNMAEKIFSSFFHLFPTYITIKFTFFVSLSLVLVPQY